MILASILSTLKVVYFLRWYKNKLRLERTLIVNFSHPLNVEANGQQLASTFLDANALKNFKI
jgi:hypothetical protein